MKCVTYFECGWCDFSRSHQGNVKRHELVCEERKRQETSLDIQPISKDELGLLFAKTGATTFNDFNTILDFFMKRFGKEWFEKGSKGAVAEYCNSLEHLHESEEMTFQVTPVQNSYFSNLSAFSAQNAILYLSTKSSYS